MNCDRLARWYRTLEHLAFARQLEKARFAVLNEAGDAKRALLLGEGDGRFVAELAKRNTSLVIDCIEASGMMINTARRRLQNKGIASPDRIRFLHRDARLGLERDRPYDLIVSHFFLDCFSEVDARRIVADVRSLCVPGAKWLIADFQEPEYGWRKWHARCWLATMYGFFRLSTGLQTRRLPNYRGALLEVGFTLRRTKVTFAQLISSEVWEVPRS